MKFKFIKKEGHKNLPKSSGVYCFKGNEEILYIGKATNLRERVKNHFQQPGYKDYLFLDKVEKIGWISTNSEIEALILEANLIKKYQPKYNVLWKDDKNYFFVGMTKEDFPRIFWAHQRKIKNQKPKIKIEYCGPFVDGKALKQTLKILRKIFPYRSCLKIPKRPCLWYHLNYCPGPCLLKSKILKEVDRNFLKLKKISQKNAQRIMKILRDGKVGVLRELKREMKEASKNQEFEEAARLRDQIEALERVMEHSRIFEVKEKEKEWPEIEEKLRKILKIENKISRIEGYDISQIHGEFAVGSMVTFVEGRPEKNLYRRFKIKFTKVPSDIEMIKEVLSRRFSHSEWGFPDLILIDGGRAQLNAALECKRQRTRGKMIKMIALAKKENKLFLENRKNPVFLKNLPREIFNLILRIRDEAHRFAISFHKKLREKNLFEK